MLKEKPELLELFNIETAFEEDKKDAIMHGKLVSNFVYLLAKELNMPDEYCSMIADVGMIHDIGKLQLGDYLYGRRANALKIEEIKYVRMHPKLGYEFLTERGIGDEEFRKSVLHHHENYDGSGYPDNIKGDKIPLGSRILRVCDVYSALISERPYRRAFDKDTAMELMIDEVKNFDMEVFLALMRVVHSDSFTELEEYIADVNDTVRELHNQK